MNELHLKVGLVPNVRFPEAFPGLWSVYPVEGPLISLLGKKGVTGIGMHLPINVIEAKQYRITIKVQNVDFLSTL